MNPAPCWASSLPIELHPQPSWSQSAPLNHFPFCQHCFCNLWIHRYRYSRPSEVETALRPTRGLTCTHGHDSWPMGLVYLEAVSQECLLGATSPIMWPWLLSSCPLCSPEAQPKYVKGGKRYGRRSLPEFQESVEEFAEVTVLEPLDEEAKPSHIPSGDCNEVRSLVWDSGQVIDRGHSEAQDRS